MPQNIKINELLGDDFKEYNYAVTSNWRIDFSGSNEFKKLLEGAPGDDGHPPVLKQLSFACHSDFQFEADVEYAEAEIKGIHISQAAWQDRFIDSLPIDVYENMDHRVFKALVQAANKTAGYFKHRDIAAKTEYTFDGITLTALGNTVDGSEPSNAIVYHLKGVQIKKVQSPNYTSDAAEIGSVQLELKAHGWTIGDDGTT